MINVFQNEKEYTISVTIPIKKVNFLKLHQFQEDLQDRYTSRKGL